jgi:hypothetical protein
MSEMGMVERVARALCRESEIYPEDQWERLADWARAAIEAMRPAPNDMLEAMHSAMFETPFDGTTLPMLGSGFDAAINTALTTSPST